MGVVGGHDGGGAGAAAQDQVLQLHEDRPDAVVDAGQVRYAFQTLVFYLHEICLSRSIFYELCVFL